MEPIKEKYTTVTMSDKQSDKKMPAMPMRGWMHETMQEQGDDWPSHLQVTMHEGVLRVESMLPEARPAAWATVRSGAVGEIGFVFDAYDKERIVWRPAWGYALTGDADDTQPWRMARNGREAMALLLEGISRQLQPEREGWCYETLIEMAGQSTDVRYRDTHSKALYAVMHKIRSCLNHRNAVRHMLDEALQYYDPQQEAFAVGAVALHIPRWTAQRYYVHSVKEVNAVKSQTTSEIRPSQTKSWEGHAGLPAHEFIRYENAAEGTHAFVYGKSVPTYVREAMEASNAQARVARRVAGSVKPGVLDELAAATDRLYRMTEPPENFSSSDNQLCVDYVPPAPEPERIAAVVMEDGVPRVRSIERRKAEPNWQRVERAPMEFDLPEQEEQELAAAGDSGCW